VAKEEETNYSRALLRRVSAFHSRRTFADLTLLMALAIGLVEPFLQTFAFAFHKCAWNPAALRTNNLDPVEGTAATPLRGPGVTG
jgi:hypothetical protein